MITRKNLERVLIYGSVIIPLLLTYKIVPYEFYYLALLFIVGALFLEVKKVFLPRWLINLFSFLFILLFFLTVNTGNFLEKALQTILLLTVLKLFEEKKLRDYFQIYLLELLLLAGASFYYYTLWFFILLIFHVIYTAYSLFLHFYMEEGEVRILDKREIQGILLTLAFLIFLTFQLSLVFFLLLPRLQNPLFSFGGWDTKSTTGFTEMVRLGKFSEIQESTKPAFRITFEEGKVFNPENLYFRVIVYDTLSEGIWSRREFHLKNIMRGKGGPKKGIWGRVYLVGETEGYLPILYGIEQIRAESHIISYRDGVIRWGGPPESVIKYEIYVQKEPLLEIEEEITDEEKELYLQVPKVSDSIRELAKSLAGKSKEETLKNILQFFQKQGFRYTLKNLPLGEDALEEFLFKSKKGNCEYFASAVALLLRLNGVPARLVGGYRSAIYQERGNYYLVQQNFAHSWVEAYLDGSWRLIETTPPAGLNLTKENNSFISKIKLLWDTLNFYYVKFIVDYDLTKQKRLLSIIKKGIFLEKRVDGIRSMERDLPKSSKSLPKLILMILLIVFLVLMLMLLMKKRGILFMSEEKRVLMNFLRSLEKRGYRRVESEGLWELIAKIKEPELKKRCLPFVKIYSEYYYRERKFDREILLKLKKYLEDIKKWKG